LVSIIDHTKLTYKDGVTYTGMLQPVYPHRHAVYTTSAWWHYIGTLCYDV